MIKNLNFCILLFFCIASITPIIAANLPSYGLTIIYLLWFCTAFMSGRFYPSKIYGVALLGLAICWFYKITGISSASIGNYMNITTFYTMPICMLYVQNNYSLKQKWILAVAIIVVFFASVLSNIYLYNNLSSYTMWSYTAAAKEDDLVKVMNLGDTSFTVGSMIYCGVLALLTLLETRKIRYVYLIGFVVTIYYNIVCAGRASVVLLLVVMLMCMIKVYKDGGLYLNRAIAFILPILLLVYFVGGPLFHYFGDLIDNERLSTRIHAIGVLFDGGDTSDEETLGRGKVSMLSIETWLRNIVTFFFGIGDHRYIAGDVDQVYKIGIGGHSSFFDTLARYGIIGFSLWLSLFIKVFKYIRSLGNNKIMADLMFVVCVMAFARSFTGGVFHAPFSVMTFLLLPCSITLLNKKEEIW